MFTRSSLLAGPIFLLLAASAHAGHEVVTASPVAGAPEFKKNITKEVGEETKIDLVTIQADYVFKSDIHGNHGRGQQSVAYESFEYGHRFLLSGNWYLRAGVAYDRYDFSKSNALVPGKLQSVRVPLALEYVQNDYVGATVQIEPGFFFENEIHGNNFDIPWEAYFTMKLKGETLLGVLGASGAQYYSVPVVPVVGLIWIIDDAKKWRIEAVFPRPAIVYNMSDDWEFRLLGEIKGGGYRASNSSTPKLNDAVVEYYEYRVGAQMTFSHWKPFDLVLNAGYSLQREFDYFRADKTFKTEPAPYVRLELDAEW